MVLRKKLAVLALTALSVTSVAGCSSTGGNDSNQGQSDTGKIGEPYAVLANQNARGAIAMAIDKETICNTILNNGSSPVDYFTSAGLGINDEGKEYQEVANVQGYSYNKEEAKAMWEKAKTEVGFDTVELELLTFDTDTSKKQAEFMQAELQNALPGLTVKVKQQPFKQKLELEAKGEFHLAYAGWGADYPDPLTFLETMVSNGQYSTKVNYSNPQFDKLIDEAKSTPDKNESWKKYGEAENIMLKDAYLTPFFQKGVAYLQKDIIKDIVVSPTIQETYKWADIDREDKTINLSSTSDIPTLDPSKATDAESFFIMTNTMEGLVRMGEGDKALPAMAESWETSEDGKTWTFKLRPGIKWSNGDDITAQDFVYSWHRTLNPKTASEYSYILYDVVGAKDYNTGKESSTDKVGIKALDDNTLQVELLRPVTYFDKLMAFPVFFPQNQKVVEEYGETYGTTHDKIVYNGPFIVSDWKLEDQHTMSKNETYWESNVVKLKNIKTKIVKDGNAALNLYETGGIDKTGLTSENVDKYKDSPEFKTRNDASTYFFLVNGGKNNK
ncbi:MAG: ABC transporter substrate-binding protein [Paraclostridium sp.]|uniref:ABC transporter substrate-binding protein n=1 Tax=Paraclostridium sp. TaxID=2023273 RepID=UPI003F3DCF56